jgi:hypothetical protein
VLATERLEPVKTGSAASVRGHIWRVLDSVNAFLQFYFKAAAGRSKRAENGDFARFLYPMVNGF